jgi:hypothetical protein
MKLFAALVRRRTFGKIPAFDLPFSGPVQPHGKFSERAPVLYVRVIGF